MAEAAAQEETKVCSNCERAIEISKIRMHEIGCARNNYKCRECGDIVAKVDRDEHDGSECRVVKEQLREKEEEEERERQAELERIRQEEENKRK